MVLGTMVKGGMFSKMKTRLRFLNGANNAPIFKEKGEKKKRTKEGTKKETKDCQHRHLTLTMEHNAELINLLGRLD